MEVVSGNVLERLRGGGFARSTSVCRFTNPWLAELIGRVGFDALSAKLAGLDV